MRNKIRMIGVALALILVALFGALLFMSRGPEVTGDRSAIAQVRNGLINLVAPAFASGGLQLEGATFLEGEGGISAYVNVGRQINLDAVRDVLRGVSSEGSDYLIGTIELAGLIEEEFPLVYAHQDGWLVTYYTKFAPASRIMFWNEYDNTVLNTTTLEEAIGKIAPRIGVDFSAIKESISFYHFQIPDATIMVLVADLIEVSGTDTFNFFAPFDVNIHEGSWSHFAYDTAGSTTKIDSVVVISSFGSCDNCEQRRVGFYDEAQLTGGFNHVVAIVHSEGSFPTRNGWAGVAVVLIYSPL